jgi:hypothetical protein
MGLKNPTLVSPTLLVVGGMHCIWLWMVNPNGAQWFHLHTIATIIIVIFKRSYWKNRDCHHRRLRWGGLCCWHTWSKTKCHWPTCKGLQVLTHQVSHLLHLCEEHELEPHERPMSTTTKEPWMLQMPWTSFEINLKLHPFVVKQLLYVPFFCT